MDMIALAPVLGQPDLICSAEEPECLLIRLAQEGDLAARDELQRRYHGWRVKRCARFFRDGLVEWNDLLTTAWLAFSEAIDRFDPANNNGLAAYSTKWVDGALARLSRNRFDLGIVDESRAARWLRANWREDVTPEDVVGAVGGTHQDAQRAIWAEAARRGPSYHVACDTAAESGDGDSEDPDFVVDDKTCSAKSYTPLSAAEWAHYSEQRAASELRPIGRSRYEADQMAAHRFARSTDEVFLRICVGERILYPIIGGYRRPR